MDGIVEIPVLGPLLRWIISSVSETEAPAATSGSGDHFDPDPPPRSQISPPPDGRRFGPYRDATPQASISMPDNPAQITRQVQQALLRRVEPTITIEDLQTIWEIDQVTHPSDHSSPAWRILQTLRHNLIRFVPMPEHDRDRPGRVSEHIERWQRQMSPNQFQQTLSEISQSEFLYPAGVTESNFRRTLDYVRGYRTRPGFHEYQYLGRELTRLNEKMNQVQAERFQSLTQGQPTTELDRRLAELSEEHRNILTERQQVLESINGFITDRNITDAELPGHQELRHDIIETQIRETLPRQMRTPRYNRLIRRVTDEVLRAIRDLSPSELRRAYRVELEQRGSLLLGLAPEAIVLRQMELAVEPPLGPHGPHNRVVTLALAQSRLDRERPQILERLAEVIRRSGRIMERR